LFEDYIYTIGLRWVGDAFITEEMSFAIHNGHLYSWSSGYLPTENPWWAN
jgi:hypothetical protein